MAANVRIQDGRRRQDSGARILDFTWLPPSCFYSDVREGSQDCLETSLTCSGGLSGPIWRLLSYSMHWDALGSIHWDWQDLRWSACSLLKAGLQPSISPFFGRSVAPDGVLRIRICTLGEAANQLMEEGFFKLFRGTVQDSSHHHGPGRFRHLVV